MHVVVLRPVDDDEIVEVYLVEHSNTANSRDTTITKFTRDYDRALARAKKDRPETWSIDEVIADLESQGWQILHTEATTLAY